MHEIMLNAGKNYLKELIVQCTDSQQLFFNRMYSHKNLEKNVLEVIDDMPEERISHAINQCEATLKKNNEKNISSGAGTTSS